MATVLQRPLVRGYVGLFWEKRGEIFFIFSGSKTINEVNCLIESDFFVIFFTAISSAYPNGNN